MSSNEIHDAKCTPPVHPLWPCVGPIVVMILFVSMALRLDISMFWVCVITTAFAVPFLIITLGLSRQTEHRRNEKNKVDSVPFLPPREQTVQFAWNASAAVAGVALMVLPAILLMLLKSLPAGDNLLGLISRLSLVAAIAVVGYFWSEYVCQILVHYFSGKASSNLIQAFNLRQSLTTDHSDQPIGLVAGLKAHWQFAVGAIVAFGVALGAVDFNDKLMEIDIGPRKARGMMKLLQWIRGNPDTVRSTAFLVGAFLLIFFLRSMKQAHDKKCARIRHPERISA